MKITRLSLLLEDISKKKDFPVPPLIPGNTNASLEDTVKYVKSHKEKEIIIDWDNIERFIEIAIEKNCKEIPWEGTDVDRGGLKEDFIEILKNFARTYK